MNNALKFYYLLFCVILISCTSQKKIRSKSLMSDVDFLIKNINSIYPYKNLYVDSNVVKYSETELMNTLSKKKAFSLQDFNVELNKYLSVYHDKHLKTQLRLIDELKLYYFGKILPLDVVAINNKYYVLKAYNTTKPAFGDEIVSINNIKTNEMFSSNDYNGCMRFGDFPYSFWLRIGSLKDSAEIKYVSCGDTLIENLDALKYEKYTNLSFRYRMDEYFKYIGMFENSDLDKDVKSIKNEGIPKYFYGKLKNKNIGVLRIDKFQGNNNQKRFYKNAFNQIRKDSIENLIIDISFNQGGNTNDMIDLVSYLTDKPFTLFNSILIKKNENTLRMAGCGNSNAMDANCLKIKNSGDGQYVTILNQNELTYQFDNPLMFKGKIYVLISNATFSSASAFAQIIKENNIGKLAGENTGDLSSNFGDPVSLKLPKSKITVNIPTKLFINNSQTFSPKGVEPDIMLKGSINNNYSCNICLLNALIALIENNVHN